MTCCCVELMCYSIDMSPVSRVFLLFSTLICPVLSVFLSFMRVYMLNSCYLSVYLAYVSRILSLYFAYLSLFFVYLSLKLCFF